MQLEKKTLSNLVNRSLKLFKNEPSLSFVDEKPFTYMEMNTRINQLIVELQKFDIQRGDRVAILGENCPNWGIAYLAITTMGAVAVPILPNFHESEVHHIIRSSGSKLLFCTRKLAYKAEEPDLGDLKTIIFLDQFDVKPFSYKTDFVHEILERGARDLSKLRDAARSLIFSESETIEEDDLAAIIYTSGTTGHSKGVMLTHKNIVSNIISLSQLVELAPGDRMLSILPLSHSYECSIGFLMPIACGAAIFYLHELPTASNLLPALKKVKPTYMVSVPLIIEKIYKKRVLVEINNKALTRALYRTRLGRKNLNKIAGKKLYKTFGGELKLIVFGGAALGAEVEKFMIEAGFPYACGYGLTETAPLLTGSVDRVKFQSPGKPIPDVQIKIVDPDPVSGIGEIYARGPNVMKGYFNDPERSAEVLTADGWLKTGDRGYLDEEGYLFIKGRSKNLILGPSGENIYPEEIEQRINESEYALESLVYEKNRRIIARVHLDYETLSLEFRAQKLNETQIRQRIAHLLEDIKQHVNSSVNDFSRIHEVIEQPEPFEKTPTQKIKRYLYIESGM
ncbi:MAG TPA: long-chain fatty acid--CoA ligase [bacterium]|nr:long-chain fatty acid--CoA ligase [bacterium]